MKSKIFVSYKYGDNHVFQDYSLDLIYVHGLSLITPRSYLNELEFILADYAIAKWEPDGEDLSDFADETIASKLRDMIYDSSITIVLISKGMNDGTWERNQWIPWEVSYSLKEMTRHGRTSKSNGMVAVVLPDEYGSYDYCIEKNPCCETCTTLKFSDPFCFQIIGKNFFNKKNAVKHICPTCGRVHYRGYNNHYFVYAKWKDFIKAPKKSLDMAESHREHINEYNIYKSID